MFIFMYNWCVFWSIYSTCLCRQYWICTAVLSSAALWLTLRKKISSSLLVLM